MEQWEIKFNKDMVSRGPRLNTILMVQKFTEYLDHKEYERRFKN